MNDNTSTPVTIPTNDSQTKLENYVEICMDRGSLKKDLRKAMVTSFPEYFFSWKGVLGFTYSRQLKSQLSYDSLTTPQKQYVALHDAIVEVQKEGCTLEKLYSLVSEEFKTLDDVISLLSKIKRVITIRISQNTIIFQNPVISAATTEFRTALNKKQKPGIQVSSKYVKDAFLPPKTEEKVLEFLNIHLSGEGPFVVLQNTIVKAPKPSPSKDELPPITVSTVNIVETTKLEQEAEEMLGKAFTFSYNLKTRDSIQKLERNLAHLASVQQRSIEDKRLAWNFLSTSTRLEILQEHLTKQSKDMRELTMNEVKEEIGKLLEQKDDLDKKVLTLQYQLSEKEEELQTLRALQEKKEAIQKDSTEPKAPKASNTKPKSSNQDANSAPVQVIEAIRREKGLDTEVSLECTTTYCKVTAEVRMTYKSLYTTLKHAINKLAVDIYSSGNRFALELLQNADDNKYQEKIIPYFHMKITPNYVLVQNNEIGFFPEHIRALCDVGGSTKKGAEFIGHKGVGFKSVFQVTDTPHIFSRGFQFKFDVKDELGYIVPEWVEKTAYPENLDDSITSLYLPLKPGVELSSKELFDGFDLVLLFLHKLKKLSICWEDKSKMIEVANKPDNIRQVDVTSGSSNISYQYYVYSQELMVPSNFLQDFAKGTKTEISLAFPLDSQSVQPVYSYLPVSSVGFHFILQADFDLTTSRQEIHKHKKWNIWLRDQFVNLFFRAYKENDEIKKNIIKYLPSAAEVSDPFWLVLVDGIQKALSDEICLETESGSWLPTKKVLVRSQHLHDLVSNKELKECLSLEFCAATISRHEALHKFHCQEFTVKHMIELLTCSNFPLNEKSQEWFAALLDYLQKNLQQLKEHVDALPSLRLFKLEEMDPPTSLAEGKIYRSIPVEYSLGKVIRVLPSSPPHLCKLLDMLGILPASVTDVVHCIVKDHLHRRIAMPDEGLDIEWETSPTPVFNQLRFIKEYVAEVNCIYSMDQLQASLCVPTSTGKCYPPSQVYYKTEVVELFAAVDIPVPELYGITTWEGTEKATWESFLLSLGCQCAPQVIITPLGSELAPTTLALLKALLSKNDIILTDKMFGVMDKAWDVYRTNKQAEVLLQTLRIFPLNTTAPKEVKPSLGDVSFVHIAVFSKEFGADIPLLLSPIKNLDLLKGLNCFTEMNLDAAEAILEFVPKSPQSLGKFKILYKVFAAAQWMPSSIYLTSCNDLVKVSKLVWDGDEDICNLIKLHRLQPDYSDMKDEFMEEIKQELSIYDLKSTLFALLEGSNALTLSVASKYLKEHSNVLEKVYAAIEEKLKEDNFKSDKDPLTGMLILNERWLLIGHKNIATKLVACDDPELEETIFGQNYFFKFAPVNKMLLKFPLILQRLNIPKLSTLIQSELSLFRPPSFSKPLTEKYRACVRFALQLSAKVLSEEEKAKLSFLVANLRVFATEKVYVQFKVHEHAITRRQPFYYDQNQCLLVTEQESVINLKILTKLLPDASSETVELQCLFQESAIKNWLAENPISISYQPPPQWNLNSNRPIAITPTGSPAKPQSGAPGIPSISGTSYPQAAYSSVPLGSSFAVSPTPFASQASAQPTTPDFPSSEVKNENTCPVFSQLDVITQSLEDLQYMIHHSPEELVQHIKDATQQPATLSKSEQTPSPNSKVDAAMLLQMENRDALVIGQAAETFVWFTLLRFLPSLATTSWVSSNRSVLFPDALLPPNDAAGFDFEFSDSSSVKYRIEVKGHLTDAANGFHFTENERRKAMECHGSAQMKYVIVGVAVTPQPHIIYTLVDPVQMESGKQLKMTPSEYMVTAFDRTNCLDKVLASVKAQPAQKYVKPQQQSRKEKEPKQHVKTENKPKNRNQKKKQFYPAKQVQSKQN